MDPSLTQSQPEAPAAASATEVRNSNPDRRSNAHRPLRWYRPDLLYEVCIRTIDGTFFFDPKAHGDIAAAFHAIFARAQKRTGVAVFAYFALSNHYHGLFAAPNADAMADFLSHAHAAMARLANRTWKRAGRVFAATAHVVPVIPDEVTVADRLTYIMGQALKAGVAPDLLSWPGAHTNAALLSGEPVAGLHFDHHRQTLDRRLKDGPKPDAAYTSQHEVRLSVVPCWQHLDQDEVRARYRAAGAAALDRWGPTDPPFVQVHDPDEIPIDEASAQGAELPPPEAPEVPEAPAAQPPAEPATRPTPARRRSRPLRVHAACEAARKAYLADYKALCQAWEVARERLCEETDRVLRGEVGQAVVFPLHTFPGVVRSDRGR